MRHIIDLSDLTDKEFNDLYKLTTNIIDRPEGYVDACRGKVLGSLFYEPSTRTNLSFSTAMMRLGGSVVGFSDPRSSSTTKGGTLAVQIPSQGKHPMHRLLNEVTHRAHWADRILSHRPYNELTEEEYFDILSENASDFRMWEITYFLRMPSCESILEWYRGTGLRPYLAQLSDEDKREFEAEILEGIREIYPVQRSGEIIFRFPRLFFIAKR